MDIKIISTQIPLLTFEDTGTEYWPRVGEVLSLSGPISGELEDIWVPGNTTASIGEIRAYSGSYFVPSYSDLNFPDLPTVGTITELDNGTDFIKSFAASFPSSGNIISGAIPSVTFYTQNGDVCDPVIISDGFVPKIYFYKKTYDTQPNTYISGGVNFRVTKYSIDVGDDSLAIENNLYISSSLVEEISTRYSIYTWGEIKTLYGLDDNATAVYLINEPDTFCVFDWSIPYPICTITAGGINAGFSCPDFSLTNSDYFLVIQESESEPEDEKTPFGFMFPGNPNNPPPFSDASKFLNWSVPPFEKRIIFQNYSLAVPNIYLKRK